jgi:predicted transposase YbfD/YdcC
MVESGICLAQLKVDSKSNEIKGIPEILSWLNIEGAVVTTDAIGTQKDIVSMIIEKGADFVLPVKANQENTQKDIELVMMGLVGEQELEQELAKKRKAKGKIIETSQTKKLDSFQELEKGHSRMDRRTYHVWNEGGSLVEKEWPGVKAVGMVIRERLQIHYLDNGEIDNEQPTTETQFYIMSRKMKAEEFACYTRGHWGIENGLHWVLDDVLREDRCTSRKGHSTENLCLMRKIVYNLLKLDENVDGKSVKAKQVYYRNNPDAICRLIFEIIPGSRT